MTNEQILQLAARIFSRTWEHSMIEECEDEWFYKAGESKLLKFARKIFEEGQQEEIRRQKTGIGYVNGMLVVDEF